MKHPWEILPEKFLTRLPSIVGEKHMEQVLKSFCIRNPSTFRANTLKISAKELKIELAKLGIEAEEVPWYTDAFMLKNVPQKVLTETAWYKEGYLYIQSLSSMIPPLVLSPAAGEKILDITAAPGSKTTQIAALMGNTGEIIANDLSRVRLYKLEANLKMQGVTNTRIEHMVGEQLWKKYPEYFDKTLVDVPCSMEGRFFVEDPKTYEDWSTRKIQDLANKQQFILRSAISSTKPGGTIVYSTCTLSPEENEGIINWILSKEKDAIVVEDIAISGLALEDGITHFQEKKPYNPEVMKTKRIIPSNTMEGFFVAKLKKVKSTIGLP